MPQRLQLLIIDPQNDFCDLPPGRCPIGPGGAPLVPALPVAGAHADMQRLASFIDAAGDHLADIAITLDSHHRLDIAHPTFWERADGPAGSPVAPFTTIVAADVRGGRYRPRQASARDRVLAYLDALEARGRYTLMVWPVHCQIGSWGHGVHADVLAACSRWEDRQLRTVAAMRKGENPWTEHYSALLAEVPDADDPHTQLNRALIERLDDADALVIAGEASSHCVRATVEDLVDHLPAGHARRMTLLTDCMSPVTGFEAQHRDFLSGMQARGLRLAASAQVLPELQAGAAR